MLPPFIILQRNTKYINTNVIQLSLYTLKFLLFVFQRWAWTGFFYYSSQQMYFLSVFVSLCWYSTNTFRLQVLLKKI